jgi:hypothetical protein
MGANSRRNGGNRLARLVRREPSPGPVFTVKPFPAGEEGAGDFSLPGRATSVDARGAVEEFMGGIPGAYR